MKETIKYILMFALLGCFCLAIGYAVGYQDGINDKEEEMELILHDYENEILEARELNEK